MSLNVLLVEENGIECIAQTIQESLLEMQWMFFFVILE